MCRGRGRRDARDTEEPLFLVPYKAPPQKREKNVWGLYTLTGHGVGGQAVHTDFDLIFRGRRVPKCMQAQQVLFSAS